MPRMVCLWLLLQAKPLDGTRCARGLGCRGAWDQWGFWFVQKCENLAASRGVARIFAGHCRGTHAQEAESRQCSEHLSRAAYFPWLLSLDKCTCCMKVWKKTVISLSGTNKVYSTSSHLIQKRNILDTLFKVIVWLWMRSTGGICASCAVAELCHFKCQRYCNSTPHLSAAQWSKTDCCGVHLLPAGLFSSSSQDFWIQPI